MDSNSGSNEIEFNSMVAVLKRLDLLTYQINMARDLRSLSQMCDCLINYFKEISSELTDTELEIWDELQKVRMMCAPLFVAENSTMALNKLDNLDIRLRRMAKVHGFLTKIKDNPRGAMLG